MSPEQDRARGALYGLAIGDALGMPTQLLSRRQIVERWGHLVLEFEPGPADHPIAAGRPAGSVTDDTEQAVLLGRLLLSGRVDPRELASALSAWEDDMKARGSLDLLGPSTRRAIDAVRAGTPPEQAGRLGDTNGAAMRIAPVGIAVAIGAPRQYSFTDERYERAALAALADKVQEASLVTHNTTVALAGAAAVAAAVSAGIGGDDILGATWAAIGAARLGAARGHWVAGADVAYRISWAMGLSHRRDAAGMPEAIGRMVGTSLATTESVPAAFAVLSAVPYSPLEVCRLAASLGGDTDTIAAMAGAIAGACHGLSAFPDRFVRVIDSHGLGLAELADSLLALRR